MQRQNRRGRNQQNTNPTPTPTPLTHKIATPRPGPLAHQVKRDAVDADPHPATNAQLQAVGAGRNSHLGHHHLAPHLALSSRGVLYPHVARQATLAGLGAAHVAPDDELEIGGFCRRNLGGSGVAAGLVYRAQNT